MQLLRLWGHRAVLVSNPREIVKQNALWVRPSAEFHRLHKRTEEFNQAMRALARPFSIVHIHGNKIAPCDETNDFPVTGEITWVNKDILVDEPGPSTMTYPREGLDFANSPPRPDYKLRV